MRLRNLWTQLAGSTNDEAPAPVLEQELPPVTNEYVNNVFCYFAWEFIVVKSLLLGKGSEERPWTLAGWGPGLRIYAGLRSLWIFWFIWIWSRLPRH